MSACTAVFANQDVWGKTNVYRYNITGSNSYPAGGYGTATGLPVQVKSAYGIIQLSVKGTAATGILYEAQWDLAAQKLRLVTAGAEASGDVSAVTLKIAFLVD